MVLEYDFKDFSLYKGKKSGKDQESSPTPDPGRYMGK